MRFRNFFSLLLVIFTSAAAVAQVGRIEKTVIDYDKQRVDALTVSIKPARKDIQKAFDDWMDDRYDINMKGGGLFSDKNMRQAEAVTIPAISDENITLMARTEERGGETYMTLFATRGLGNYITSADYRAFDGMERVFDAFLSDYLPEYYEERVAEAREELEDLRDDLADAEEDVQDNEKKIEKLRRENEELRTSMTELRQKITDAERNLNERERTRRQVRQAVSGNRRD